MLTGTVVEFARGVGLIQPDRGGQPIQLHYSACIGGWGHRDWNGSAPGGLPRAGDRVGYEGDGDYAWRAWPLES